MAAARAILLWLVGSALGFGQSGEISQRLQAALADTGQGKAASEELKAKDFVHLNARLKSAKPANDSAGGELLALRGAVAFLADRMTEAVSAFQQADKLRPLEEGDRFTLAMAFVKLGEDEQARDVLKILAREHPQSGIYVYWLGRLDYDQRRYSESVEKLRKATDLDPQSARAWDGLGLAWDMQGQTEAARKAFDRAVILNRAQPKPSPWPPHNLGYLLFRMGEEAAAEKALRESLGYNLEVTETRYYLGRVLEKEGRDGEAITEYRTAVTEDPQTADACYSLAILYRKLHRNAEAEAMFVEFRRRKK